MINDGIKAEEREEDVKPLDIAQVLEMSVDFEESSELDVEAAEE
jgi:hypothetical protein